MCMSVNAALRFEKENKNCFKLINTMEQQLF